MKTLVATVTRQCWVIGTKQCGPGAERPYHSIEQHFTEGETFVMSEAIRAMGLAYFTVDGYRFAESLDHFRFTEPS